ncbi:MAG: arginase, partial [Flavobacteriaceae bacterium]
MAIELLTPVPDEVFSIRSITESQTIGNKLKIHSEKAGIPSFKGARIAIVGIQETRSIGQPHQRKQNLNGIRKALYSLYIGNWNNNIIDLGDIPIGEKEKDSHKALHDI